MMIPFFNSLRTSQSREAKAKQHYVAMVTRARAPELYTTYQLPDSLDGRFEAIVLQLFVEQQRLKRKGTEDANWLRLLHEAFFEDMDRSLREIGVGDTGVGKRVKRMASALFGRLSAYEESYEDATSFEAALLRNVYATADDVSPEIVQALAVEIRRSVDA